MPTLPLYSRPTHPDASHSVGAPGGYEWWYFDAEDTAQNIQIVGILLDGFPFHPQYLRRHARYLRRPTKVPPVVPADYPCAYLAVYENGKLLTQFMSQYPAGSLRASTTTPEVHLGPNTFTPTAAYLTGHPWALTGRGPQTDRNTRLSADVHLAPLLTHTPVERTFLSRDMTGAEHHWILASPLNRFTATITFGARTLSLSGLAYHDHNFGTAPLGPGLRHWIWGRVLTDSACHTFHYATPRNPKLPPESHLITATPSSLTTTEDHPQITFNRRSQLLGGGIAYPDRLKFPTGLSLTDPLVLDNTPFYLRLQYKARLPDGSAATALTEVATPNRLRWPVLGRMIEMSINRTPPITPM